MIKVLMNSEVYFFRVALVVSKKKNSPLVETSVTKFPLTRYKTFFVNLYSKIYIYRDSHSPLYRVRRFIIPPVVSTLRHRRTVGEATEVAALATKFLIRRLTFIFLTFCLRARLTWSSLFPLPVSSRYELSSEKNSSRRGKLFSLWIGNRWISRTNCVYSHYSQDGGTLAKLRITCGVLGGCKLSLGVDWSREFFLFKFLTSSCIQ